jgi:hypothetical protein
MDRLIHVAFLGLMGCTAVRWGDWTVILVTAKRLQAAPARSKAFQRVLKRRESRAWGEMDTNPDGIRGKDCCIHPNRRTTTTQETP